MMSPITAVTPSMSLGKPFKTLPKRPNTCPIILNGIDTTCNTNSNTLNRPFIVRLNLSAVSSDIIKRLENLCSIAMMLNNVSGDVGGNTSLQAFFIASNTFTKPCPAFLKVLRNNQRPSISSNFSKNSLKGKPSCLATRTNSLKDFICSSVYPFAFNSASDNLVKAII